MRLWETLKKKARCESESEKARPWEASYPSHLSWRFSVEAEPLSALLQNAVATYGSKPCLEFFGRKWSYAETGRLVAKAAEGFQELGVKKGTKVGLFLPNCPYYVISFHAILMAGGTVVNFNPLYAEEEVARQIRDSETKIMVTMDLRSLYSKLAARFNDTGLERIVVCPLSGALPFPENLFSRLRKRQETASIPRDRRHLSFKHLTANRGRPTPVPVDPHGDIAVLQYTGGTTGLPKGAMLTHANLHANALQIRAWASSVRPGEEKFLAVLPLCHAFGMTAVMNFGLSVGAELILLPRFKVGEALQTIERKRPSVLMGVPTIYSAICSRKDIARYDLSSLRFCVSGAAPLPPEVRKNFERLARCPLLEGYGLTEAGPVCTINPLGGKSKPGSAGLPLPGTLIEVVSLRNPAKALPLGEVGEICVSGPQVMKGYWRREDETRGVLRHGRLRTGDLGYMDRDGYLFLTGRIKEMIITGGFKVYPRAVEEAMRLHPAIERARVCGVPDQHRGEIVKAYVKLREGARLAAGELRAFLADKLAAFEIPRDIDFVTAIPEVSVRKAATRAPTARAGWSWKRIFTLRPKRSGREAS